MENTPTDATDINSEAFENYFRGLVDSLLKYQKENDGKLPYGVWTELLRLQGSYFCLEVLVLGPENEIYLKRRDDPRESNWFGKLHIVGKSERSGMTPDKLLELVIRDEIVREMQPVKDFVSRAEIAGFVKYPEPERKTTADTLLVVIKIEDPGILQEGFERLTDTNLSEVIEQHRPTLEWWRRGAKPQIFDVDFFKNGEN